MPKISFAKNKFPSFDVENNSILMTALLTQSIPVASSCLGKGVCSKCRIKITAGRESLSSETELEQNLREKNKISDEYRISCQAQVLGDVSLDTDYW